MDGHLHEEMRNIKKDTSKEHKKIFRTVTKGMKKELHTNKFKINILKRISKLQQNRKKQVNDSRKMHLKIMRSSRNDEISKRKKTPQILEFSMIKKNEKNVMNVNEN